MPTFFPNRAGTPAVVSIHLSDNQNFSDLRRCAGKHDIITTVKVKFRLHLDKSSLPGTPSCCVSIRRVLFILMAIIGLRFCKMNDRQFPWLRIHMVVSCRPQTNFKEVFIPESNQTPSQPYIPSAKSYWHMTASQGDTQRKGDKKRFTIRQTDLMRRLIEENQHLLALQRLNCSVDPIKTRTRAVLHKTLLPVLERKTIAQVNRLS